MQLFKPRYFGDKELNIDKICKKKYIAITYQSKKITIVFRIYS